MKTTLMATLTGLSMAATANGLNSGPQLLMWLGLAGTLAFGADLVWSHLTSSQDQNGRYEATVFVSAWGHPDQLWHARYRFQWVAALQAKRMVRYFDCMGDVYSEFGVNSQVRDLSRARVPLQSLTQKPQHIFSRETAS